MIPFLPPGQYELSCEFTGFKKFLRTGLVLETGSTATVDVQLEVGAVTDTVVVKAATPLHCPGELYSPGRGQVTVCPCGPS